MIFYKYFHTDKKMTILFTLFKFEIQNIEE